MARKRTIDELHELEFETFPFRFGTNTSFLEQCITPTRAMQKEYLLSDENGGRKYRPRVELTEKINGNICEPDVPERLVAMDVYICKEKKGKVKSERPKINDRLHLRYRYRTLRDEISQLDVVVIVTNVGEFGSVAIENKDDGSIRQINAPNHGFIIVRVIESYGRSLCFPPEFIKRQVLHPIGR